jgi:hypothetical protein
MIKNLYSDFAREHAKVNGLRGVLEWNSTSRVRISDDIWMHISKGEF